MRRQFQIITVCLAALVILSACGSNSGSSDGSKDAIPPKVLNAESQLYGFDTDTLNSTEYTIKSGETFSGLTTRMGIQTGGTAKLLADCGDKFSVRSMRAGAKVTAYYSQDSLCAVPLRYFVYHKDRIHKTVFQCFDSLYVKNVARELVSVEKYADICIENSLSVDAESAGVHPVVAYALSDIYAWTVDFFNLRKGDHFKVFYSEYRCDDEFYDVDEIHFCLFTRDNSKEYAIRVDDKSTSNKYWNEKGMSLRKAFLKAPLDFKRVSSTFSYARKHPVTGKVRPHTGVDYAAPSGTPVRALGDGTVISAQWDPKGGGNTIKIRHNSVYTTAYLHLKGYAKGIKGGARVSQGQVIGYVGSTGTSTGPHLDFRVWKNGTPINPLTMESPSTDPLKKEYMPQLDSVFNFYSQKLQEIESQR